MRRTRVCIYGGTDLEREQAEFVSSLAYEILDSMQATIVTGGFGHRFDKPDARSTDSAALDGARRYAEEREVDLLDCFEAWVPEPRLDGRPDVGGVIRMTRDLGISVRTMQGRTALGRRLAMVANVDLVVTVSGVQHTEVVAEQALELGIPVLPIPATGGDSEDIFDAYKDRIVMRFHADRLYECLDQVTSHRVTSDPSGAAKAIVHALETARCRKCLILLPFDTEHDRIYESTVEPAVSRHMFPLRLNEHPMSEQIHDNFVAAMRDSVAVIADITRLNENVMYEVGYASGRGLRSLIYTRDLERIDSLPIYLKTRNVHKATDLEELDNLIDLYLSEIMVEHRTGSSPYHG